MRNTPLHESHLLEAVRRKIVTSDQMEQVLALARSLPPDGAVADVRWATVVQGLIAGAAVMGSGLGLLIDVGDNGVTLGTAAYSAVGLAVCLALSHYLGRFSWGRAPGSIVRAGAAVWSFGVFMGLLGLVIPLQRQVAYGSEYYGMYDSFRTRLNTASALALLASGLVALGLWRLRRCAPALGVAGMHAMLAVTMYVTSPASGTYHSAPQQAIVVLLAGAALFAVASVLDRLPRGAVDGTFWLYPVAMFPMGCAAILRIDRHEGEVSIWLPLALALGAVAYANGRRLPLLFTAAATMIFPAFALAEARAPSPVVVGALAVSAAAVAAAVQLIRARDLRAHAAATEAPSVWG